jgi:hypothetical protein
MPRGDGTGPRGEGPYTGKRGGGMGRGTGRGGGGMGGGAGGAGGYCVCPACGHRASHVPGTPCNQVTCSACGARMVRR